MPVPTLKFPTLATACLVTCLAALWTIPPGISAEVERELPEPLKETEFQPFDADRAALGRLLFYDPILSGNRNISCGTCHNHQFASTDGLSLGVGEGGTGLGPKRQFGTGKHAPVKRVPRNANALFNLGHRDFRVLFHDGRASVDDSYGRGFNSPAEEWLPEGLSSLIAAQALFPLTSRVEMAGDPHENEIAAARRERIDAVWPRVTARVKAIDAYWPHFQQAWPELASLDDISIIHIANAIGDFIVSEWRSADSPFDAFLGGNRRALTTEQQQGLDLFYGKARCSTCHSGALLTDQKFYALALPPFGPGRTRLFDPFPRDLGRMAETDDPMDAYRFRTPSLRNVAATGPWGHNGAYASLEGIVRHHLDPLAALAKWDRGQVLLPKNAQFQATDFVIWDDQREMARLRGRIDIKPVSLGDDEVKALVAFLHALTGKKALQGRLGKPKEVPSGLDVD